MNVYAPTWGNGIGKVIPMHSQDMYGFYWLVLEFSRNVESSYVFYNTYVYLENGTQAGSTHQRKNCWKTLSNSSLSKAGCGSSKKRNDSKRVREEELLDNFIYNDDKAAIENSREMMVLPWKGIFNFTSERKRLFYSFELLKVMIPFCSLSQWV